jgi:pantoate--beta-alanine ligase
MKIIKTIDAMREFVMAARCEGKTVGVVPTMGALHAGHFSLIDAARAACDVVVVTIFVNPTQFAPTEDLEAYPRTPESDHAGCEQRGVDAIFTPDVKTMYPAGAETQVLVPALAKHLCGKDRPTHFGGVCVVVSKLFNIIPAHKAFFGAKDYQQSAIIRKMVVDLNFDIEIVVCPTVRESDGLAMSSRNAYLSADERRQAPALHGALQLAREMITGGQKDPTVVLDAIRTHLADHAPDGKIDYVNLFDPDTLEDVSTCDGPVHAALAVRFGGARLIDNMRVDGL